MSAQEGTASRPLAQWHTGACTIRCTMQGAGRDSVQECGGRRWQSKPQAFLCGSPA